MKSKNNCFSTRKISRVVSASAAALMSCAVLAGEGSLLSVDCQSQGAAQTLRSLAKSAGVQIMIPSVVGNNVTLPSIKGEYTLESALKKVLDGSGLTYEFRSDNFVVIVEDESDEEGDDKGEEMEEIVVTGSRLITDPGKMTRQVTIFTREEIERSGMTRLDEFLQRLPQNVNAPTNVGSGDYTEKNFGLGINAFAGSSVNLRGLGAQYTLVLIDGRRPAKGGQFGGIADISNIPIERVERIEILFDGAAAIYGADAVGGVINIITNREFDGSNFSLTYSDTTQGGGQRLNASLGHTFNWGEGSLTATFDYQGQEAIDGNERNIAFIGDEPFTLNPAQPGNVATAFGASALMYVRDVNGDGDTLDAELNERLSGGVLIVFPGGGRFAQDRSIANPASIIGYTPVNVAQLPENIGSELTLYDIADTNQQGESVYIPRQGFSLSPKDETYGVSLALNQDITDDLALSLSLSYSETEKLSNTNNTEQQLTVTSINPHNPFSVATAYSFSHDLPSQIQQVDQWNGSVTGDLDYTLNDNWNLRLGFGYNESDNQSVSINAIDNGTLFQYANGEIINFIPGTGIVRTPLGSIWDPLLGLDSEEEYIDALINPFGFTISAVKSSDVDMTLRGVLGTLPAGDIQSSFTLSYLNSKTKGSNNNTELFTSVFVSGDVAGIGVDTIYDEAFSQTTKGISSEIAVPLVGRDSDIPFVENFLLNSSIRVENYSNVSDRGVNWAAGFNWGVSDWLTLRFNRTYSLRVPEAVRSARPETLSLETAIVYREDRMQDGFLTRMDWRILGGSENLESERNYGNSLAFIVRPNFLSGLDLRVNFHESHTYDQIGFPGVDTRWTPTELLPENVALNPLLSYADDGRLIVDGRAYNIGDTYTRGADMRLSYNVSSDYGSWLFSWSHQYLDENLVTQSDICPEGVCSEGARFGRGPANVPVSTVDTVNKDDGVFLGAALPRNRGFFDLNWSYRGLGIGANSSYQQDTTVISRIGLTQFDPVTFELIHLSNQYAITTKPVRSVNMTFSYDFSGGLFKAPKWLETTRVQLTVNNVWFRDQSVSRETLVQEFDPEEFDRSSVFSPFGIDARGRAYSLRFVSTF